MNDAKRPGAPVGDRNAEKQPEEKLTGKGRITADFGDLKAACVKAAKKRGMKLVLWLREAEEEKILREDVGESGSSAIFSHGRPLAQV